MDRLFMAFLPVFLSWAVLDASVIFIPKVPHEERLQNLEGICSHNKLFTKNSVFEEGPMGIEKKIDFQRRKSRF